MGPGVPGSFIRIIQSTNPSRILILPTLTVLDEYGQPEKFGDPISVETLPMPENAEALLKQPHAISGNGFYGEKKPAPAAKPAPAPARTTAPARATGASDGGYGANLYPIEALSPYAHKWTIRARVTHKSPMRSWHNANGDGRLFSVNLLDESAEIRATAFHSVGDVFDQWYEMLQEGQVYYISNPCQVKLAKKQFTQINNDYELMFERDTRIEKAQDQGAVPQVRYNFTPIGDLGNVEKDTTIDAIGILKNIDDMSQIVSKASGKPFNKREITIVDNTLHQVRLTVWGEVAESFDAPLESVIAFKGLKVSDFGGRSLSLLNSGSFTLDPDIDEAHQLKGWYEAQGHSDNFVSHANAAGSTGSRNDKFKTIAQVKEENLGTSEQPDFFTLKATVVYIRSDGTRPMYYEACRSDGCNRKVIQVESDPPKWDCSRCNKSWDAPERRYVLSFSVSDHTGSFWLDAFDDTGRLIMGMTANEFHEMKENGTGDEKTIIDKAICKSYIFRCKAKLDTYNDQQR
jgi:replication factor A1